MSTCSKKSSRIICICCYTFYAAGLNIKKVKWKNVHIVGWAQKSPGRGSGSWRRTAPALRGSCMDLDLHHLTGSFFLRRGFVASRGGFPVVRGTGRPAGSRYLRLGGVLPEVATSVWRGAPPEVATSVWGGAPPEVATSVWGASRRKGFLCLERAPPDRVISSSARCP